MAGATIARAPRARTLRTSSTDWSAGRVTSTVRPASGFTLGRPWPRLRGPRGSPSAPSAMSSFVASAAAPSGESDTTSTRATREPSGAMTTASISMRAPSTVAIAPSGSAQLPPSRHINERSASSARSALEVIERRERRERRQVVRARLERERALSRRGDHHVRAQRRGVGRRDAETDEAGQREHGGVDRAVSDLPQTRVDVAAQIVHGHARERPEQLRASPDAGRSDHRAGRERRFTQHQHVRRIHAGRDGGDHQPLVVLGRKILGRVDRDVDLVAFERVEDRVDEQPFQPGGRVARRRALVARRRHRDDLGVGPVLREPAPDLLRLHQGERRTARPDPERHSSSGSRRRSSISSFACRSSAPGSERSFSSTIGSCRSFAATPRASASTASRCSAVRSPNRLA